MQLSDIKQNVTLQGLEPDSLVTIQAVAPVSGAAVNIFYVLESGELRSRLITAEAAQTAFKIRACG